MTVLQARGGICREVHPTQVQRRWSSRWIVFHRRHRKDLTAETGCTCVYELPASSCTAHVAFLVFHQRDLCNALTHARVDVLVRRSMHVADVMGWGLTG